MGRSYRMRGKRFSRTQCAQGGIVLALLMLQGCGDDGAVTTDAMVDAPDSSVAPGPIAELPALPILTPCALGFREVEIDSGLTACDPAPAGGVPECPDGQAWFVGESGCIDVGAPCPAGQFSDGLPETGVVYVDPAAAAAGDGSRTSPHRSFDDIGPLGRGVTIALSKGVHAGPILLPAEVQVVGACAAATSIASASATNSEGVFTTSGGSVVIRDLTIARSERPAVIVFGSRASLTLEGVIIREPRLAGVIGFQADVTLRDVLIRDVRLGGSFSRGADIEGGGSLTIERVTIRGESVRGAVYVGDEGTTATVSDLYVHDIKSRGIAVETGATASFERVFLERIEVLGIFVGGEGASATVTDAVIRDIAGSTAIPARGIDVTDAHLSLERFLLDGVDEAGAIVAGPSAVLTARDGVIRRVGREGQGIGMLASDGARLELERTLIEDVKKVGVAISDGNPSASLVDVTIRHVQAEVATGLFGRGLNFESGVATGQRVLVEDVMDTGIFLTLPGTHVTLADLTVRRVESEQATGQRGIGIQPQRGAVFDGTRVLIEDVRQSGVLAVAESIVSLTDVIVRRIGRPACTGGTESCPVPVAIGVGSVRAALNITRFEVGASEDCGFQVSDGGALDAFDGLVTGSSIGACIQVSDYDLDRVSGTVRYEGNESNLQTTSLPVPDAAPSLTAL